MSPSGVTEWYILGAGSMGLLWASYLKHSGQKVTLLLKNEIASQILTQKKGRICIEIEQQQRVFQIPAIPVHQVHTPVRFLLITVKAYNTLDALRSIHSALTPNTVLVLLQNGMGVLEQIQREYPHLPLIVGSTTNGAYQLSRFHVVHAGKGMTWLGPSSSVTPPQAQAILEAFQSTELNTTWDDQIQQRLWTKLAINCAINALTAILQCRNGDLIGFPFGKQMIEPICHEVESLMERLHIPLSASPLKEIVYEVVEKTSGNYSSMYQDLQKGIQTEIDYINGFVVQKANALGLSCPYNQLLVHLVHFKEALQASS
ncbi:2-dehydropantoate 2-reductase [Deltaproteobacteria bacterium TL4]